ncbi:hypothetical protein SKUD_161404 [Saccharomyces kudriavzevii IFO 1802]|uniref:Uncharacterized protein n=1 Tax=Saccharomyces kudriavzevii (strain ATCC MYA-4449 / AS 2.2408 / CBS 8840 / NBRC 1802 / NCYC 2889) TaxID=226230 RepID=J8THY0_SACK1|nr:hypothetical protein SKUD_161404 [Saccharomyces kudriavzevii IFO 1802]
MADSKAGAKTTEELSKVETIVLPRDKTNKFVHFFKQNIRVFYLILLHIIVITIFGYVGFHTEGYLVSSLGIFLMIVGFMLLFYDVPLFYYISLPEYRLSCLSYSCKMKLLVEVITHKPNVNTLT